MKLIQSWSEGKEVSVGPIDEMDLAQSIIDEFVTVFQKAQAWDEFEQVLQRQLEYSVEQEEKAWDVKDHPNSLYHNHNKCNTENIQIIFQRTLSQIGRFSWQK